MEKTTNLESMKKQIYSETYLESQVGDTMHFADLNHFEVDYNQLFSDATFTISHDLESGKTLQYICRFEDISTVSNLYNTDNPSAVQEYLLNLEKITIVGRGEI